MMNASLSLLANEKSGGHAMEFEPFSDESEIFQQ